jgi:EEF1A lysine methyltransferase 2
MFERLWRILSIGAPMLNSLDKDVPDSSDVEPPMLGLQNFQDDAYAEDVANFHERSHADDW